MSRREPRGINVRDNMQQGMQLRGKQCNIAEDDYHIPDGLKRGLEGIIATIQKIDRFGAEMGSRNFIFHGPPGTGKTMGVEYIATRLDAMLYDGKQIFNAHHITEAFNQLRQISENQPVLLLLDELDRYSTREEVVDPAQGQTLNQLLTEMNGLESNNQLFIFGTTNMPDKIDSALRRPGRFDKEIEFMPPHREGRLRILQIHAEGKGGHKFKVKNEDLEHAAGVTFGYTGADLRGLLNEAFENATLDDRIEITQEDLEYALTMTNPSALKDMPFKEPAFTLDSLGGYSSHKELVRRLVENSNGTTALFYGPPGTGKSALAEAIAGDYGYNLLVVSGSEPQDKYVGETGKKLDKYLRRAKQLAPCVLLFDEIDALVESNGMKSWKSSWTGLLQSKLSQPIEGVYVVATVNDPTALTKAFRERFVHKLYFGLPSVEEQPDIWRVYLPEGIDPSELVSVNQNLTGRDISRAHQRIKDYGIPPSVGAYRSQIEGVMNEDSEYGEIVNKVGDSVADYGKLKAFITQEAAE